MKSVPREAKRIILIGLIEKFAANFIAMSSFIWLTTDYLPATSWEPATTSTIFLALVGLSIFLVLKQTGSAVDHFKPYGLFLLVQVTNLVTIPLLSLAIFLASPQSPLLTLLALAAINLLLAARAATYSSSILVLISHLVPQEQQADYYSLDFRFGLIALFLAPVTATYSIQYSVHLGLGLALALTLLSLLLLLTPSYRALEQRDYGQRISWTFKSSWSNLRSSSTQQAASTDESNPDDQENISGLKSLKYVKHINIILLMMATEALGNRARESFDIYFVTGSLGLEIGSYGFLTVALSAGLLLGSLLTGWTRKNISWQAWPAFCYTSFGLCFAAKGLAPSWELVLLTTFGEGLFLGLLAGIFQAAKIQFTPPELLGRTNVAFTAVFQLVSTLGLFLWAGYAWFGANISPSFMNDSGYRIAFCLGGCLIALSGLMSTRFYREVQWRKLEN